MDRYTCYNEKFEHYNLMSNKKPWSLEYQDLVNIIGELENKIEEQDKMLKLATVRLLVDIQTPTDILQKGRRYLFTQEEDGSLFIYKDNPTVGIMLTPDEVDKYIDWEVD